MTDKEYTWSEVLDYVDDKIGGLINLENKTYKQSELDEIIKQFNDIDETEGK